MPPLPEQLKADDLRDLLERSAPATAIVLELTAEDITRIAAIEWPTYVLLNLRIASELGGPLVKLRLAEHATT